MDMRRTPIPLGTALVAIEKVRAFLFTPCSAVELIKVRRRDPASLASVE
jgi:hypothetical protein